MDERIAALRALCDHAPPGVTETGIPRLVTFRGADACRALAADAVPALGLVLRGSCICTIGGQTLRLQPATCFVTSADQLAAGTAQPEPDGTPFLALSLALDAEILEAIVCEAGPANGEQAWPDTALSAPVGPDRLDAWLRLLQLRGNPVDIAILAPACEREIIYRALLGPQGPLLRAIAAPGPAHARIRRSIQLIRQRVAEPLAVAELADAASLSPSAFHRQFKAVTALSPVQFHKRLRLLRARSVLVSSGMGVAAVGHELGYDNVSQFTRDYARFFGLPPATDRNRIKRELA